MESSVGAVDKVSGINAHPPPPHWALGWKAGTGQSGCSE